MDEGAAPTKACAVENPIPLRFTPVTNMVLPWTLSAKALATSKASVLSLNSGCVVAVIVMLDMIPHVVLVS